MGHAFERSVGLRTEGAKQTDMSWFDSDRKEDCRFQRAEDGHERCLPPTYAMPTPRSMFRHFVDANRHKDFELSRRLRSLATDHPLPDGHPRRVVFDQAARDLEAIVAEKAVVARWQDYRSAFDTILASYRDAFVQRYDEVRQAATSALEGIHESKAFKGAPAGEREAVVARAAVATG